MQAYDFSERKFKMSYSPSIGDPVDFNFDEKDKNEDEYVKIYYDRERKNYVAEVKQNGLSYNAESVDPVAGIISFVNVPIPKLGPLTHNITISEEQEEEPKP